MENQLKCPQCGSTDIENLKKGALYLAIGSLVVAACLYFVFPVIKIVAAFAIFGVLCLGTAIWPGGNYLCRSCKHKFKNA